MRSVALGCKNYLLVGSQTGGKSAAIADTLIETAKLNGVDPQAWLADSHTAHRLQIETEQETLQWIVFPSRVDPGTRGRRGLTPAQEAVAVELRRMLLLPLDDLLAVVREFLNPNVSRSGLDRCLRRHGVGNLRDLRAKEARPKHSGFKACEPGYIHIDVKYLPKMADESSRRYLFVAMDPLPAGSLSASATAKPRPTRGACLARSGARLANADPHHLD